MIRWRILQRANDRLATNWTLHDLRHSATSRMANDPTLTLVEVQSVLRHRRLASATVPLATRYDAHERVTSEPQPFLFQRTIGQRREAVSPGAVTNRLRRLCAELAEQHPGFKIAHFTPQDFRRLLATELINSRLAIHIGAGHAAPGPRQPRHCCPPSTCSRSPRRARGTPWATTGSPRS